jgi:hypothetical protein
VTDFESFAFGVHKFLKAAQRGNHPHKAHKYLRHMLNCARIRRLCRETRARRHQLAMAGVMWAMEHTEVAAISSKSELQHVFDTEVRANEPRWSARVDRLTHSLFIWRLALLRSLGPRRAFA